MSGEVRVAPLARADLRRAMELVWRVFGQYEAPEYAAEGIEEFRRYIEVESLESMLDEGRIALWGAKAGERVVGVLAAAPPCHVSLLFVDPAHHRRGIAKRLFGAMLDDARGRGLGPQTPVTVNSSPYAVPVYTALGFGATADEQLKNGIRFLPMERTLGGCGA